MITRSDNLLVFQCITNSWYCEKEYVSSLQKHMLPGVVFHGTGLNLMILWSLLLFLIVLSAKIKVLQACNHIWEQMVKSTVMSKKPGRHTVI